METLNRNTITKIGWLVLLLLPFSLIGQERTKDTKRSSQQQKKEKATSTHHLQKNTTIYTQSLQNTAVKQSTTGYDINSIIQMAMRESYTENIEDLKHYAEKVKHFNDQKKKIREHIKKNRERMDSLLTAMDYVANLKSFRLDLIVAITESAHKTYVKSNKRMSQKALEAKMSATIPKLINRKSYVYVPYRYSTYKNIPNRVPDGRVISLDQLNRSIVQWEGILDKLRHNEHHSDISEMQRLDLQNVSQKQQQLYTILTNMMKTMHDTQKAIINNLRG